jgi:hypothetical protein
MVWISQKFPYDSPVAALIYSQYLAPEKPVEPSEEEASADEERLTDAYYPYYDYEYLGFFINLQA